MTKGGGKSSTIYLLESLPSLSSLFPSRVFGHTAPANALLAINTVVGLYPHPAAFWYIIPAEHFDG